MFDIVLALNNVFEITSIGVSGPISQGPISPPHFHQDQNPKILFIGVDNLFSSS
jgi:hypothetical protein